MRFDLTGEQRDFAGTLDKMLGAAGSTAVARAWADGDTAPGLDLWHRCADDAVHALLAPEENGGIGASTVDGVIAFEALGRHVVPGPWVESVAFLPRALGDDPLVGRLAEGAIGTVAVPPHTPRALDTEVAEHILLVDGSTLAPAEAGTVHTSVDPTRRLADLTPAGPAIELDPAQVALALDTAVVACSAQLVGLAGSMLDTTVAYAGQRRQFGREIGSYQAVKHALADVRIAVDFARPLVYGAALSIDSGTDETIRRRDASAAKILSARAADLAARTALQVHGAIGYTRELDLSLAITRTRALLAAWGTSDLHRSRVHDALLEGNTA